METIPEEDAVVEVKSSYRTYEEWKHFNDFGALRTSLSSYRTYEEWKLALRKIWEVSSPSSYRTYEEWKHFITSSLYNNAGTVLTVPMRNGNIPLSTFPRNSK